MRKLLILDLDETLIHSTTTPNAKHHFSVGPYAVFKRPSLDDFLHFCNAHFDIAIWTSSTEDYAQGIVAQILPPSVDIVFLWSRDRCVRRTILFDILISINTLVFRFLFMLTPPWSYTVRQHSSFKVKQV